MRVEWVFDAQSRMGKDVLVKHSSNAIHWDDTWHMIQIKQYEYSQLWVFFARLKSNKEWYYGEGETLASAIENCEKKIEQKNISIARPKIEKLEELF